MDDEIDYVLSIMDELTKELIKEGRLCNTLIKSTGAYSRNQYYIYTHTEQAILAQYEADFDFSEDALCAAIESLSTNDVICPICQK